MISCLMMIEAVVGAQLRDRNELQVKDSGEYNCDLRTGSAVKTEEKQKGSDLSIKDDLI